MYKDVAWEERQLQSHTPILPSTHGFIQWQVSLDGALAQLLQNALFVVRARLHGVPAQLNVLSRQYRRFRETCAASSRCRQVGLATPQRRRWLRLVTYRAICDLT